MDELQANYITVLESMNPELYAQYVQSRRRCVEEEAAQAKVAEEREKNESLLAEKRNARLQQVEEWHKTGKYGVGASFSTGNTSRAPHPPQPPAVSPPEQEFQSKQSSASVKGAKDVLVKISKHPAVNIKTSGTDKVAAMVRSPPTRTFDEPHSS